MGIEDILQHRRYNNTDAGKHAFAGLRQIENKTFILLKTFSEILVLPVNDITKEYTKQLKLGKMISVNDRGIVRKLKQKI